MATARGVPLLPPAPREPVSASGRPLPRGTRVAWAEPQHGRALLHEDWRTCTDTYLISDDSVAVEVVPEENWWRHVLLGEPLVGFRRVNIAFVWLT